MWHETTPWHVNIPPALLADRIMISALRTPDKAFDGLSGFPFAPHYLDDLPGYPGLRLHYLDEGPRDAPEVWLCLHGEPTWSYLYRHMIPEFLAAGHRVLAPDLFGFGRSDKPTDEAIYTFDFHRQSLLRFVEQLDLHRLTLVLHDWGGFLGLTLPMDLSGRVSRLLLMNTNLVTGEVPLDADFLGFRAFVNTSPELNVSSLMTQACRDLSPLDARGYGAPFPDERYQAGVRRFPNLVPNHLNAPGAALSRHAAAWLEQEWIGQSFMAVGARDASLGVPTMQRLQARIRGCPAPLVFEGEGHFLPEEAGVRVARAALAAFTLR